MDTKKLLVGFGLIALGLVLFFLGLILQADASECRVISLDNETGSWRQTELVVGSDVKTHVVGPFVWVGDHYDPELFSVEIPSDAVGATICPDGSVTFEVAEVTTTTTSPVVEISPIDRVIELPLVFFTAVQ